MFQKMFKGKETAAMFLVLFAVGAVSLPLTIFTNGSSNDANCKEKIISDNKKVNAYAVKIKNKKSVYVKDKKSALGLLKDVKELLVERFKLKDKGAKDVVFADSVELKKVKVNSKIVLDMFEAQKYLLSSDIKLYDYKIKDGDTFWDLSIGKDLNLSRLLKLNQEHIKSLKSGDVVKLYKVVPRISLKWKEQFSGNEEIPFTTIKVNTSKLFKGNTVTTQNGKNGIRKVEAIYTKVDGEITKRKVMESALVAKPVERHLLVGTSIKPPTVASGIFKMPVFGSISSRFGARWGKRHTGIDLSAPYGQAIKATDGGKVIFAGWYYGYGKLVKIDHENGYVTYYGHCSQLNVSAGERVYAGQVIAHVGSTGHSTGPHLHFEVRINGVPVNPWPYINK